MLLLIPVPMKNNTRQDKQCFQINMPLCLQRQPESSLKVGNLKCRPAFFKAKSVTTPPQAHINFSEVYKIHPYFLDAPFNASKGPPIPVYQPINIIVLLN